MRKIKVHLVAGARPNFMKIAPVYKVLKGEGWCDPAIVHTRQHYDGCISEKVLRNLGLKKVDIDPAGALLLPYLTGILQRGSQPY